MNLPMNIYLQFFLLFFKIGMFTIGGGYAKKISSAGVGG